METKTKIEPDVRIDDQGTLVMFEPISQAAKDWFSEHVQSESWQWMGTRLGVDHRMAQNLVDGIEGAGFTIGN